MKTYTLTAKYYDHNDILTFCETQTVYSKDQANTFADSCLERTNGEEIKAVQFTLSEQVEIPHRDWRV